MTEMFSSKKSRFLIISVIICANTLYGQNHPDERVICSACPKQVQLFEINKGYKLDSLIYKQLYNEIDSSSYALKAIYTYNSERQLVMENLTYWQGYSSFYQGTESFYFEKESQGIPGQSTHAYKYDKNGLLIEDLYHFSDSVAQTTFESKNDFIPKFDEWLPLPVVPEPLGEDSEDEGIPIYLVRGQIIQGGYKASYSYDNMDRLSTLLYEIKVGDNYENYSRLGYSYDKNGNRINETFSFADSTKLIWKQYKTISYIFNDKGQIASELISVLFEPFGWMPFNIIPKNIIYSYDSNGILIKKLFQQQYDNVWEDYKQIVTKYHSSGDSLTILTQTADGGVWYNSEKWTEKYDANNYKISSLFEYPNFEEWESVWLYNFRYDKNGNRIHFLETPLKDEQYYDPYECTYYYSEK